MKKITNIREQILYSRNGEFTIKELSELAEPTDILSVALNGWEVTIYKHVQREETDEEYERRLLQEQYQEDWKKYQELKLKFHL
jgi:hypothetical protein